MVCLCGNQEGLHGDTPLSHTNAESEVRHDDERRTSLRSSLCRVFVDGGLHAPQVNRHDAGLISDQVMQVPVLCDRDRIFVEGLSA